jgi:hypothetical protein
VPTLQEAALLVLFLGRERIVPTLKTLVQHYLSLMYIDQVHILLQLKYLSLREALLPLVVDRWLLTVNGAVSTTQ